MMHRRMRFDALTLPALLSVFLTAAVLIGSGCKDNTALMRTLQQRADQQELAFKRCAQALADRDAQIASLQRRVDANPTFADINLDDLFTVDRIEIVSRTGGADFDGKPGDDGVIVYVRPLDAQGDTLKAAGRITVQLLDLTTPGAPRELATHVYAQRAELAKSWYGGMLTDHYTLKCPIPAQQSPPPPREVHVRVTFLDWLSGREFVESKTVRLNRIDASNAVAAQPVQ